MEDAGESALAAESYPKYVQDSKPKVIRATEPSIDIVLCTGLCRERLIRDSHGKEGPTSEKQFSPLCHQ